MSLPTTILVATDFSPPAEHALDYAIELANKLGAKVHLVNVIGIPTYGVPELGLAISSSVMDSVVKSSQSELDKLVAARAPTKIEAMLRTGDARDVIINTAVEVGAQLIVMGTHGRRGVSRALLGSVAESVVRHAPCPVLIVRADKHGK